MIEQTEFIITQWNYYPPAGFNENDNKLLSYTSMDVMRKRAASKKGIACRFTCHFVNGSEPILEFIGENSYVIDLADVIDKGELKRMISNAFEKCKEKFDLRKLGTALQNRTLAPLDESNIDFDAILPLLV